MTDPISTMLRHNRIRRADRELNAMRETTQGKSLVVYEPPAAKPKRELSFRERRDAYMRGPEQKAIAKQRALVEKLNAEADAASAAADVAIGAEEEEWSGYKLAQKGMLGTRFQRNTDAMQSRRQMTGKHNAAVVLAENATDTLREMIATETRRKEKADRDETEAQQRAIVEAHRRKGKIEHAERFIAAWNNFVPHEAMRFSETLSDDEKLEVLERGTLMVRCVAPPQYFPQQGAHGNG